MAQLGTIEFDTEQQEALQNFGPLPAGRYNAIVEDSEIKPTKAGTGAYLQITLRVSDGEFQNRLIWGRYNVQNPNPQAEEIAKKELTALCHAVGFVGRMTDSAVLHGRPVALDLIVETDSQGRENNRIRGYSATGAVPVAATPAKPAASSKVAPPWQKARA